MIKTGNKLGLEGMCLNLIKDIIEMLTANIILNIKKQKALLWGQEQGRGAHSHHLFSISYWKF